MDSEKKLEGSNVGKVAIVGDIEPEVELKVISNGGTVECEPESPVRGSPPSARRMSMLKLIFAGSVAGGAQYLWSLQYSLLTPYIQTLGVPHAATSFVWLGGPVAGFLVQPTIGLWSDRCHSKFGRRRPFIFFACIFFSLAVFVISFSADIGYALGDTKLECSVYKGRRVRAIIIYVIGYWMLDFSYNAIQTPSRALMTDIAGERGWGTANSIFCSWMAFGNIVGYGSCAIAKWNRWFPILLTKGCCEECANLKGAYLVAIVVVLLAMVATLVCGEEIPLCAASGSSEDPLKLQSKDDSTINEQQTVGFIEMFKSLNKLPQGMIPVLIMTSLSSMAYFPFGIYNTNWMGREIYHGEVRGNPAQVKVFNEGVKEGSFGLLLNSCVLAIAPFIIFPLCRRFNTRIVWVICNAMIGLGMVSTLILTKWSDSLYNSTIPHVLGANSRVKAAAVALFSYFGFPIAAVYAVPFAATAQLVAVGGGGQGLYIGILSIAMVIPQVICSLGLGPFSKLIENGKSDVPAFLLGGAVAFLSSIFGAFMLPKLSEHKKKSDGSSGD